MVDAWYTGCEPHRFADLTTPVRDDGEGPTLVCVHGFPTSSWDFEPMWPSLTARFRCVAFDLIGLGRASKPNRPLPIGLQADLCEDLLVARGIESAHLLAHDLGDTVAQELLARQAEGSAKLRWQSCAFLNGGIFPETHQPRPIQKLLASPLGPLVARLSSKRTFERTMRHIFGAQTPPSQAFLDASWALLVADGGRTALPRLIRYMGERRTHRERWVTPLIDRVVPMRMVNGNADPVSGRHAAERFAELVQGADIVHLPDLGHYPHVEDPSAVLAALDAFWDGLGVGG